MGVKEGVEGQDFKKYLENLLIGCLTFAYRLGYQGKGYNMNRDHDVLLGFPNGKMKTLVLDSLWDSSKIAIEGQQLTFYSDLCPLTIQRRREWNFLTRKLVEASTPYKWGFPDKLLIEYKGKIIAIKTTPQAK